jgi:hypothetical protein
MDYMSDDIVKTIESKFTKTIMIFQDTTLNPC